MSSESGAMDLKKILARRVYIDTFDYQSADQLAALVPKNTGGKLYFKEGQFFSCVYFGYKRYAILDYHEPAPPEWWVVS